MELNDNLQPQRKRRTLLLHFRWLLFLWLSATLAVQDGGLDRAGWLGWAPLGLMLLSQLTLWQLPPRHMDGLKVYYSVFLFDLMLILLNLQAARQLDQPLAIAFFLGIFVAALTHRVGAAFLASLALAAAYLGVKSRAVGGLAALDQRQWLDLPFLLIATLHSGLVAQEAETDTRSRRKLVAENGALSHRLKSAFFESSRFNHDIKALLDTLPFGVVMLDQSGGVRLFNATAELFFGLNRKCVLGSLLGQVPELACLQAAMERMDADGEVSFQRMTVPQAEGYPVQLVLSSYRVDPADAAPVGTLLVLLPLSYHQAVAQYVAGVPLDDRLPLLRSNMPSCWNGDCVAGLAKTERAVAQLFG